MIIKDRLVAILKYKVVAKLKYILQNFNEIQPTAVVSNSAKISGSVIFGNVKINDNAIVQKSNYWGEITFGSNSSGMEATLHGTIVTNENCKFHQCYILGNVAIGKYTSIWGPNINIISNKDYPIKIGSFCSIARNVSVQTYNHNYKKATTYFIGQNFFQESWDNEKVSNGIIIIENDVWIGADVVVLGGVTIGNGAVIAANSTVLKNVPPYSIVAGSPAKVIGYRFEQEIIEKLLDINWWNWSDEQMKANKSFFESEMTLDLIQKIQL